MNKFLDIMKQLSILAVLILLGFYWLLISNYGSKALLYCGYQAYNYFNKNNIVVSMDISKIHGDLLSGIILNNVVIRQHKQKLTLNLEYAEITVNILKILSQRPWNLIVKNVRGHLNRYPIQANLNILVTPAALNINGLNFIKVGENFLYLSPRDSQDIDLQIRLNELGLFLPQMTGKISVSGSISNNFRALQAKIGFKNLQFDNIAMPEFTADHKNTVTINAYIKSKIPYIKLQLNWDNLTGIMDFCPMLARLKGKLIADVEVKLAKKSPQITANVMLQDITFSLPEYGIKIKPLNVHINSANKQMFNLSGIGYIRNTAQQFNLKGQLYPFNLSIPSNISISGKNLNFINTDQHYLCGDLDLNFVFLWLQQLVAVNGNVTINEGTIDLSASGSNITKSKDVIFVNSNQSQHFNNKIRFIPDIKLRILDRTRLLNAELNAIITGKLRVYSSYDHDNNLLAEGRISIKQGVYNFAGKKFTIEKGRMIYLPGTLLTDPSLDISVIPSNFDLDTQNKKERLYIEGSIHNPIVKDSGIFNEKLAILHVLNFCNNKFNNNIKKKFNLEEFEIQENTDLNSNEFENFDQNNSLLDNKNFVIGKKLFNDIYLRYLKPLNTQENKIKLNKQLNLNWTIEIGSSSEDGYGGDLKFYKESN